MERENRKLEKLKKKLSEEYISECPILLFVVNETIPMPDDDDYEYEYVYYCPDMDVVEYTRKHFPSQFLPNFIDMRDFFKDMKMPKRLFPGNIRSGHKYIVDYSVDTLKHIIDDLFDSGIINSWQELAFALNNLPDYYTAPKYEDIGQTDQAKNEKFKKQKKIDK